MPDGSVILVEIKRGTVSRVTANGKVQVVAKTGGGPNGAAFGPDGKLYVCNDGGFEWHEMDGLLVPGHQPSDYSGGRIERVDVDSGKVEVLYTKCDGHPLRGPNDIVFDTSGGFWFTDHGKVRERDRDRTGVYYAKPDGSMIREAIYPIDSPNGVGLSPDGKTLYVAETWTARIWAWDLSGPGQIKAGAELFTPAGWPLADGPPGIPALGFDGGRFRRQRLRGDDHQRRRHRRFARWIEGESRADARPADHQRLLRRTGSHDRVRHALGNRQARVDEVATPGIEVEFLSRRGWRSFAARAAASTPAIRSSAARFAADPRRACDSPRSSPRRPRRRARRPRQAGTQRRQLRH